MSWWLWCRKGENEAFYVMRKISILIPAYNEEESLPCLCGELDKVMGDLPEYDWEVLFVNDGSSDNTLRLIKEYRKRDSRFCYVDLSRNFGKESAMLAGLDYVTGDCVIIMDADLQDPPFLLSQMIAYWEEGYDDVYARRTFRGKEPWWRRKLSLAFYKLLQFTTNIDVLQNVGDFRLLDRKCIEALRRMRETERYTKGLFCWIGYHKKEVLFDRADRCAGKTSFNFLKLMNLGIEGVTSFTTAPLRISAVVGIFISIVAFIYMCYILVKTLVWGDPVQGFPTLMVVILFLGGIQLIFLGIMGEYLGRIFNETKKRPVYIAREYNDEQI